MNVVVPLLVEETPRPGSPSPMFTVRPLLDDGPHGQDEHLSRAVTKLANELRKQLDGLGRNMRHDDLLRWTFCPEVIEHHLKEKLILRRGTANVRVLVVAFDAIDRRIAMMPALPNRWFDVNRGQRVTARAREILLDHLNELQKESEDFELPEDFTAKCRHWTTTLELDVRLEPQFEEPPQDFFALLGGGGKMSGRAELHKVGRCLDWLYPDELERAILRESEVDELHRLLGGADRRPVLLLGPPLVGKTTVIHECVHRRVRRAKSPHVSENNVWLLSPQRLISGMSYVGQWENRVTAIFDEAKNRNHVLYFDDVLGLYYAGLTRDSDLTVAHVLKPHVERHDFRVLAEMTPEAFRVLQEKDRGMADLFHVIPVRPTGEIETRRVCIDVMRQLEDRYRCRFSLDVLPQVLDLSNRYQAELAQPGKSALMLRQLASKLGGKDIDRSEVLHQFHASSGLSISFLDSASRLERGEVIKSLQRRITAQDPAVEAMADTVCIAKARLNDPTRPLGTFLFLGPTGVGKTQCAKTLTAYLFNDEQRLLRFDMNEYVDASAVARLNGTFREPEGLLTSAIRRQPFSVVLLDEIEKAHPAVFDVLLQVLGEGRLTDALGRTANFGNAIIIMTSNLGAREAQASFGLRPADRSNSDIYVSAAEHFFRPEFFNRIDRIVPFERLTRPQIAQIARQLIGEVFQREGLVHRRCVLDIDPAAMEKVIDEGFHPDLGARALKRCIETQLTQPVAARLAELAPDAPTVIRLFPAGEAVRSHLEELANAPRRPLVPEGLDLNDWADVLDRVEDAIDRIERQVSPTAVGKLTQGQLSSEHFRYLAIREYAQHLRRFVDRIDRTARSASSGGLRTRPSARLLWPRKKAMTLIDHDAPPLRELRAAEDFQSQLVTLEAMAKPFGETVADQLVELIHETALLNTMTSDTNDKCLVWIRCINDSTLGSSLAADYQHLFQPNYGFVASEVACGPHVLDLAILLEMPGICRIMSVEEGTHLSIPPWGNLEPVQVIVRSSSGRNPLEILHELRQADGQWRLGLRSSAGTTPPNPFPLGPVVRIFTDEGMIVDLRSGLAHRGKAASRSGELRKFILSQLEPPEELRI